METALRCHLLVLGRAYAAAKGLELSTVARVAAGDWRFFSRLENGAAFTARKYDAVVDWFLNNWPADAAWPEGVAVRPLPAAA